MMVCDAKAYSVRKDEDTERTWVHTDAVSCTHASCTTDDAPFGFRMFGDILKLRCGKLHSKDFLEE